MSEATPNEIELMRHALGLNREKQSYRNHFCTGPGTTDFEPWELMVAKGFAVRREPSQISGGDYVYSVTDEGRAHLTAAGVKP